MKAAALFTLAALLAAPAAAKDPMQQPPKGRYTICLMPWGCGAKGTKPKVTAPDPQPQGGEKRKPEEQTHETIGTSNAYYYQSMDPLARRLRRLPITSAIRLDPADTGSDEVQVLVIHKNPADLLLPVSALPKPERSPTSETAGWGDELAGEGKSAAQINAMREERGAFTGTPAEADSGAKRMWGEKKRPT